MTTLYYSHPDFLKHNTGVGHPECADRLRFIERAVTQAQPAGLVRIQPVVGADIAAKLGLIHTPAMLEQVFNSFPQTGQAYLDADTVISPGSKAAALLAVSAVCDAVDKVCSGEANNAFCAVRPPGHHAEPSRSMGFCVFNNIAIAAEYARTQRQLDRVAIVDFDVHHGNGTQAAFVQQPNIMYVSSHQWPHYPGSGQSSETGLGNIVNLPLAAGTTGDLLRRLYSQQVFPALRRFNPQLLLISAGFDGHRLDPLADLRLETDDYVWLTQQLMAVAADCCQGRIVSVLEGGYHLQALADCVTAHVSQLCLVAQS
ncbi:histone deacetylase family protein [Methylomonas paludis]|uniref:Histone deacetylase family protein n=1 Tax=Methylomonas paludis TaxID=1173101 RepID=A0A975MPK8_9GAMM|nr:histone deacetylase family protein [Methylomonas paludis]QWF71647.1 histone deacetylase family protein [Methylomonas paludis]